MSEKVIVSVISNNAIEKGIKDENGFIKGVEEEANIKKIKSNKPINEITFNYLKEVKK